jgi:hypothetical protein
MFTCSKCGVEKEPTAFPKKGRCCKACKAVLDAAYVANNRDAVRARKNEWQRTSRALVRTKKEDSALANAKLLGQKRYSTGEPCKKGHVAERLVSNRGCVECQKIHLQAYRVFNRDELLAKKRSYAKKRTKEQPELVRAIAKRVRESMSEDQRQKQNTQSKEWRKKNKGRVLAWTRMRQLAKKQRTPAWLSDFDKLKIECYYSIAAMLTRENNESWHVDHVLPLQGKSVSGLHVPNNLQLLRGEENSRKGNRT